MTPLRHPTPSHRSRAPRHARGFTLTELMVTIVIVAVLAAIAFSVTRSVIARAHVATCSNNLRQIGFGLAEHQSEYNRYPSKNDGIAWDRSILPFLASINDKSMMGNAALQRGQWGELTGVAELFACPADKAERDPGLFKRSYAIVPWTTNWSNGTQFRGWKDRPYNEGIPFSLIREPSKAAVVVEWHEGNDGIANHLGSGAHAYHDRGGPDGPDRTVHSRKHIVLFADGHTEYLPFMSNAEFVEDYWPGTIGKAN